MYARLYDRFNECEVKSMTHDYGYIIFETMIGKYRYSTDKNGKNRIEYRKTIQIVFQAGSDKVIVPETYTEWILCGNDVKIVIYPESQQECEILKKFYTNKEDNQTIKFKTYLDD